MKKITRLNWITAILASVLLLFVLLITSFEVGIYSDFSFYEKEYVKYNVTEDLNMELSDVMDVTHEMMDYLRGDRENLVVYTTIYHIEHQEFFNDQDKSHMADVRNLFIGGLKLRFISIIFILLLIAYFIIGKINWKYLLPRASIMGMIVTVCVTGILGIACAIDFNAVFTKFHQIFFTNDLWIFDPATDYMIRMLPEGFFFDMVIRIGSFFIAGLLIILILSIIGCRKTKDLKANME